MYECNQIGQVHVKYDVFTWEQLKEVMGLVEKLMLAKSLTNNHYLIG
jgi:hypothetical protein